MAIAFHVTGTAATGTTALSVVIPATASVGDMLILSTNVAVIAVPASGVTATGWTQLNWAFDDGSGTPSPYPTITLLWRACIAGDPGATVVCTMPSTTSTTVGIINAYSGVHLTAPFETSAIAADLTAGGTAHIFPSITTTQSTDWLVTAIGARTTNTWTPPTSPAMTERSDSAAGTGSNLETADTNGTVAAGTYNAVSATSSGSTSTCPMFLGALQVPGGAAAALLPRPVILRQAVNQAATY